MGTEIDVDNLIQAALLMIAAGPARGWRPDGFSLPMGSGGTDFSEWARRRYELALDRFLRFPGDPQLERRARAEFVVLIKRKYLDCEHTGRRSDYPALMEVVIDSFRELVVEEVRGCPILEVG